MMMFKANPNVVSPEGSQKPLVYIIDDDISVCESLTPLLLSCGWAVETYPSARSFLSRPRARVPTCLILDLYLPDLNGLDLQSRIRVERSETPIIFITGHTDIPAAVRAMKAGAYEYLIKPFRVDELLRAIETCIELSQVELARKSEVEEMMNCYRSLTLREQQVMSLVTTGLLNKQVAFELGISEITVKAHRGQVMRKMKARSLPDLVVKAARLSEEPSQEQGPEPHLGSGHDPREGLPA